MTDEINSQASPIVHTDARRWWRRIAALSLLVALILSGLWWQRRPVLVRAEPFSLTEEVHESGYSGRYQYSGNCTLHCAAVKTAFVRVKLQVRWPDGVSEEEYRTCHLSAHRGVLEWSIYPYRNVRGQPTLEVLGADVYPGVTARVLRD